MSLFKQPAARDPAYLEWVRQQPSVVSGEIGYDPDTGKQQNDPHHPKGNGLGGSVKCSDYFAFPLTRKEHQEFHAMGWESWEAKHGSQVMHALKTLERWVREQERDS